jgi:hypothetical protein
MAKKQDCTRREVIGRLGATVFATSVVGALPIEASEVVSQIRRWRVLRYSVGWNTRTRVGRVALYLENASNPAFNPPSNPVLISVASLSDLPGYTAILSESPVYYTPGGWIHTGSEEIN